MTRTVRLTTREVAELDRQDPVTANDGGYQNFLVSLQNRLDRESLELHLDCSDLEKIPRYAFDYAQGGWQDRLVRIFGRELGPELGRE